MHWIALQPLPEPARSEADSGQAAQDTQATSAGDGSPALADALTALGWWALQFTPKVARIDGEGEAEGVLVMRCRPVSGCLAAESSFFGEFTGQISL